ncbi:MAG: omptin family outer membrane protease [Nitrospirota bacterium]
MKKAIVLITIITVLSFFSDTGFAQVPAPKAQAEEQVSFRLGVDFGSLTGSTLYNIKFPINETSNGITLLEGESELEFPLDSAIGGITASLGKKGHWSIDLSLSKNITEDTGKTTDIDILTAREDATGRIERGWIIYSESDTDMDAFLFDLTGKFYIIKRTRISLGLAAGYRYQSFSFDISNVSQEDAWDHYVYVPGKAATYDITYSIPYAGLALDLRPSSRFSMNFSFAYGWAFAEDEDDHILRSKKSTAKSDGPYYSIKADGNVSLSRRLSILLGLEYLRIETEGTQDQIRYANTSEGPAGTIGTGIDYNAISDQLYIWLGMRYTF